jgi:hypothetical protein
MTRLTIYQLVQFAPFVDIRISWHTKRNLGEDNCDTWGQALCDIEVMTTSQQHVTATATYIHVKVNTFGNYLTTH